MKKSALVIFAAAMSMLSCQEKNGGVEAPKDGGYTFVSEIKGSLSKATELNFEDGDAIVVSAYQATDFAEAFVDNAQYTYSGSMFTSDSPIAYSETGKAAFRAVYPAQEDISGDFTFTVKQNQNEEGAYTLSDLMVAESNLTTSLTVGLSFSRICSKVDVIVRDADKNPIEDVDVYVNAKPSLDVNFADDSYVASGEVTRLRALANGDGSYSVIIPSQTLAASTMFVEVESALGAVVEKEVTEDFALVGGASYKFYVTME